ncbi:taurine transport system permease protein/sulfonate transport system permease protein [Roseiarcus fermentans]|uniref:Taurine transport system permease protein/sulfonate transport system permease protein n=1 Tax=Roseiarcus fermentans TaxID=1473586 RepID=A0A366EJW4_9HYPH|nr:ABC transporter permease [Roseiarcus fermentans]RBP02683.1 taurine transport system permease protein/sulfonate transport system permease protein [Roseiarcus fermentans]
MSSELNADLAFPERQRVLDFSLQNPRAMRVYKAFTLIAFVAAWQAIDLINSVLHFYNPLLIPSPLDIVRKAMALWSTGALQKHIVASMMRVFLGVAIAFVPAIVLGVGIARSRIVEVVFEPLIELIRPIPPLAVLPMFILWFGIGELSKLIFIAFAAFYVIMTTVALSAANIDVVLIRAARTLGIKGWRFYREIVFPAISPDLFVGVRLGLSAGFVVIVASEFIAADVGLGYMINYARAYFRVSDMFVGALTIGVIGYAVNLVLLIVERRLFSWRVNDER